MVLEIIAAGAGIVLGVGGKLIYDKQRTTKSKHDAERIVARAETKASDMRR